MALFDDMIAQLQRRKYKCTFIRIVKSEPHVCLSCIINTTGGLTQTEFERQQVNIQQ